MIRAKKKINGLLLITFVSMKLQVILLYCWYRTGRMGVKDSALVSNKAAVGYRYDRAHFKQDIATLIISRLFQM